jgi:hypothetical protein
MVLNCLEIKHEKMVVDMSTNLIILQDFGVSIKYIIDPRNKTSLNVIWSS